MFVSVLGAWLCGVYLFKQMAYKLLEATDIVKVKNFSLMKFNVAIFEGKKERFHSYLLLYGVRHMVKDQSDSKSGNPLPPHRLLFLISSNSFIFTIPHTG